MSIFDSIGIETFLGVKESPFPVNKKKEESKVLDLDALRILPEVFQGVVFALFLGEQVDHEIYRIKDQPTAWLKTIA